MSDVDLHDMECPLTNMLFYDPVAMIDGQIYELQAIDNWLQNNNTSPMTGSELEDKRLFRNETTDMKIAMVDSMISFNPHLEKERFEPFSFGKLAEYCQTKRVETALRMLDCLVTTTGNICLKGICLKETREGMKQAFQNTDVARYMIEHASSVFADPDRIYGYVWGFSSVEIVDELIRKSGTVVLDTRVHDVEAVVRYPVHIAARSNTYPVVKRIIQGGVDIDLKDREGKTALHHALKHNLDVRTARELIAAGASLTVMDSCSRSAIHYALKHSTFNNVKMIVSKNVDLEVPDKYGWRPIHYAVMFTTGIDTIRLLLDKKVDISADAGSSRYDSHKVTPISLACAQNNMKLVQFLIENGASLSDAVSLQRQIRQVSA